MSRRPLLALFALLTTLLLSGCGDAQTPAPHEAEPVSTWLPLKIGDVAIEVQVPLSRSEQSRGLMHRESLEENRGMLFPYATGQRLSFWMKNTVIPLDIGYFDQDGVLREIYPLYPRDTRGVSSRRDDLHYALEMNQGWFRKNNIRPGAQLDREMLMAALTARGANPANFGLSSEEE